VLPEEIKRLREELKCTARELAAALKVDPKEVIAWEAGERFPTKRSVTQMEALRRQGPTVIVRPLRGKPGTTGLDRLNDPKLWQIFRKLLEHPALFDQVVKLADAYPDRDAD
jgi:transcriptional regulator with XRE-family HTH domain